MENALSVKMNDQIRGGFGGVLRSQMSPQLQRRLAEAEAAEAKEAAQEERARAQRREDFEARNAQAAIAQAIEAGQEFSPRMLRGQGYGRTRQEAVQYFSDLQDVEDRRAEAQERIEFEKWQIRRSESMSGDSTADLVLAERAEQDEQEARRREARLSSAVRNHVKRETVREARKAALGDTARALYGVERARSGY
jgi:hypothetical protein